MKDAQKKEWIYRHSFLAEAGIDILEAAKRSASSKYESNIRKLTAFKALLHTKHDDDQQFELFAPDNFLSAEIQQLLDDPLSGV